MSTWAEVDKWASDRAVAYWSDVERGGREWRAFAVTSDKLWRFRGRILDARIKCERACFHVPGRWRSAGYAQVATFTESAEAIRLAGKMSSWPLTRVTLEAVLIARDEWLEAGAVRLVRPKVIEVG